MSDINTTTVDYFQKKYKLDFLDGYCLVVHKDWMWSGGSNGHIKQWNCEGKCIRLLKGHTNWIQCLFVWKDFLYSASYDRTIRVWSIITGQCVRKLIGHTDIVHAL